MKIQTLRPDDHIGKSLTAFFKDVGNQFQMRTQDLRLDTNLCLHRYVYEGISFVTKTLPKFGKHFDVCLKSGEFTPTSLFKRGKGVLPCFMQGLTKKVFNTDGTLLDNPDCDAIRLIRQICGMFYKLEMDYPKELEDVGVSNFVACDVSLDHVRNIDLDQSGAIYIAQEFITKLFKHFDPDEISPRPGPGQTADKVSRQDRYEPHVIYKQLHEAYPYYKYFYTSSRHLLDSVRRYRQLPKIPSGISRLAFVPKDSRGPRIICMEPHEYMWLQQGLGRALVDWCESHYLTKGHVNFTDQTINGKLALQSSSNREYATLDMKEASDRISADLVDILFEGVPRLRDKLLALSTPEIALPNGDILRKKKYAPMGSALCFPVMSIVHYALGIAAMKCENPRVPLKHLTKVYYVYGDDLIVKTKYANTLLEYFPLFGMMFNTEKCCIQGHFRESCGVDAYAGVDVTPQRVRKNPFVKSKPTDLPNLVAMFQGFFRRGLWNVAKVWQDLIIARFGDLPCVTKTSSAVGWTVPRSQVFLANKAKWKWVPDIQSYGMRVRTIVPRPHASMIGGWEQLVCAQLHKREESTTFNIRDNIRVRWSRISLSAA
jgi:hypothetical protein